MRILCVGALALLGSCGSVDRVQEEARIEKIEVADLKNVFRLGDRVISGDEPQGEGAFRALKGQGVRTILSVDGAVPDVESAERNGMRYVHLPIGYDGIDPGRRMEITRVMEELPGRVYVHCFHGVHRGPAAAALGLVTARGWKNEDAVRFMKAAGTSPKYEGLYRTVRNVRPPSREELAASTSELPSRTRPRGMVGVMAAIQRRWDIMKDLNKGGWKIPEDHPDVQPAHEAEMLQGYFDDLNRSRGVLKKEEQLRIWMKEAGGLAADLQDALRQKDAAAATEAFDGLKNRCVSCHTRYRDEPDE